MNLDITYQVYALIASIGTITFLAYPFFDLPSDFKKWVQETNHQTLNIPWLYVTSEKTKPLSQQHPKNQCGQETPKRCYSNQNFLAQNQQETGFIQNYAELQQNYKTQSWIPLRRLITTQPAQTQEIPEL